METLILHTTRGMLNPVSRPVETRAKIEMVDQ